MEMIRCLNTNDEIEMKCHKECFCYFQTTLHSRHSSEQLLHFSSFPSFSPDILVSTKTCRWFEVLFCKESLIASIIYFTSTSPPRHCMKRVKWQRNSSLPRSPANTPNSRHINCTLSLLTKSQSPINITYSTDRHKENILHLAYFKIRKANLLRYYGSYGSHFSAAFMSFVWRIIFCIQIYLCLRSWRHILFKVHSKSSAITKQTT